MRQPAFRQIRRLLSLALIAVVAAAGVSATGVASAAPATSIAFPGSQPSWAKAANDQGVAAADATIEGEIYFNLKDRVGAESFATSVSTPGSRNYRKWLTPRQWIGKYSPSQSTYDAVVGYLTSSGLVITGTPESRLFVVFRGTADQLNSVFGTTLHRYAYTGRSLVGPSSAPRLPAYVAGSVSAIGIDQSRTLTRPDSINQKDVDKGAGSQRSAAGGAPVIDAPCSQFYRQHVVTVPKAYAGVTRYSTINCGYTPAQLRSAYGLSTLNSHGVAGQGQTVAIVDAYASPTIVDDVNTYSAALGERALTTYQQIVPAPSEFTDQELCGGPSGWQPEQTLDVESVHGIAPKSAILYVGGFNCLGGIDMAVSKILDGKLANIVSNSYGNVGEALPLDVLQGFLNIHLQAAGEGIGMYYSSGDSGDEVASLGYPSPDFPASSPYATAVGGTSLGIDRNGNIALETGWGSTLDKITADPSGKLNYVDPLPGSIFAGGAGGGASGVFAEPAYQRGVVPASLAKGKRVSPDIAALADPYTGFLIGIRPIIDDTTLDTGDFENDTFGGTSLASPLVAAQMAIVQQITKQKIGFANPGLYALSRIPTLFRDVLPLSPPQALVYTSSFSGNTYLVSLDTDTSLRTRRGYDEVTGLGDASFSLLSRLASPR